MIWEVAKFTIMVCNFSNIKILFTKNQEATQMIVNILQTRMQITKIDQKFLNKVTKMIGGRVENRFIKRMKNVKAHRLQIIHHKNQFNNIIMAPGCVLNVDEEDIYREIALFMEISVICIILTGWFTLKNSQTN